MKLYNIVFNPTDGTQKVADIIARGLSEEIELIDLTKTDTDFSNYRLQKEDVAVISMPSFAGRAPQKARKISKLMTPLISFALKKVCSGRKENEFF